MNKKKVKLADVAKQAGVSQSTASQYLNGRFDYMSHDTKLRLERTIKELNYVPNNIARSLKTQRTRTFGVIVRDVSGYYTSQALRGIDDYCKKHGYDLLIYNTDFDSETEAAALKSLSQYNVDGFIIASCGSNMSLIEDISQNKTPVVQFQLEHDRCDTSIVVADYKRASFEATEYLIQLGHKRICFVTQKFEQVKSRRDKFQGFVDAHAKHNIEVDEDLVLYWRRETGLQGSPLSILNAQNGPTAFFTQQIAITQDVLRSFNSAGVKLPTDVSLIGFEELPMAEFFKVPITIVEQHSYEVGSEAARVLIDKVQKRCEENTRVTVPCSLVKRDSVTYAKP